MTAYFSLEERREAEEVFATTKAFYPSDKFDVTMKEVDTEDGFGRCERMIKISAEEWDDTEITAADLADYQSSYIY